MPDSSTVQSDETHVLVQLRDLTKTYQEGEQERTVLRQLNASIADGEFVVLMGRSGAGKSTLLIILSGDLRGRRRPGRPPIR